MTETQYSELFNIYQASTYNDKDEEELLYNLKADLRDYLDKHTPEDEKLELLKEIQEYYQRKDNWNDMPFWLSVRIEKVINNATK
jgi:hypothetical protein